MNTERFEDEFDKIEELVNEPETEINDEQLLKEALTEVRQLRDIYRQEITRYKEATRQLQIGLSELKTLKEQFEELQELIEDEDETEADIAEDIED